MRACLNCLRGGTCVRVQVPTCRACVRIQVPTCVRTYVRKDAHRQRSTRAEQHDWHDWHDCRTYIRTCAFRRLAHLPSTARMTCTTDTIGTTRADSTTLALVALGTLGTSVTPCIVGTLGVACQHSKAVLHTCAHVRTYVRSRISRGSHNLHRRKRGEGGGGCGKRTHVCTYATRPVPTSVRMQRAPRPKQRSTCRSPLHGGQRGPRPMGPGRMEVDVG